ncbi:MAG: hypothetical protein PHV02_04280 [Rhodocyclaceae bacterium]|nr:hypothetical protein [Rhodocyclaceae bacterium]
MKSSAFLIFALLVPWGAWGQATVDLSSVGVKVQAGGKRSVAANTAGAIDSDVQMEGVAVINGDVFIDGEVVPKGKTTFTGKISGKVYLIKWGKDGNVEVREK